MPSERSLSTNFVNTNQRNSYGVKKDEPVQSASREIHPDGERRVPRDDVLYVRLFYVETCADAQTCRFWTMVTIFRDRVEDV